MKRRPYTIHMDPALHKAIYRLAKHHRRSFTRQCEILLGEAIGTPPRSNNMSAVKKLAHQLVRELGEVA